MDALPDISPTSWREFADRDEYQDRVVTELRTVAASTDVTDW